MKPLSKSLRCVSSTLAIFPILFFSSYVGLAAPADTNQVVTKFEKGLWLTRNQIKSVLALTRQCGLTNIAIVETFLYVPGSSPGIRVKGAETTQGRTVSVDVLDVKFSGWNDETEIDQKAKRLRGFWVNLPYVTTQRFTIFQINGMSRKVRVEEGIPLETADKIILGFAKKDVRFASKDVERTFDRSINVSAPTSLKTDGETKDIRYRIMFSRYVIFFNLVGEQIVIEAVARVEV